MKPRLIFVFVAVVLISPVVRGQSGQPGDAILGKTTLDQDQNDARDYANSLQAPPVKYGKGEKKAEINPKQLQSKSIKDATFGGSLLNMGIDPSAPKLDAAKEQSAPSEEKAPNRSASANRVSTASKQQSAGAEQSVAVEPVADPSTPAKVSEAGFSFSNLSQTATLVDDLSQSEIGAAPAAESKSSSNPATSAGSDDNRKNDQGGGEKSSPDKSSSAKSDGDR
jgi:hypothetical protein